MMGYNKNQDKMLHETVQDLVVATRSLTFNKVSTDQLLQFYNLEDAEIEDLYMQWSEKYAFISMHLPERTRIAAFVGWATMSPIQQYKQSEKGVKE